MADERNMFERRFSQFMEGLNKYGRYTPEGLNPNANQLRATLRTTGAGAGLFGDILAYLPEEAIKAITPDSVKEAAKEGIDYLINDTAIGRGIVELAKENPEEAGHESDPGGQHTTSQTAQQRIDAAEAEAGEIADEGEDQDQRTGCGFGQAEAMQHLAGT